MPEIHPTALVSESAQLDDDVKVGPFSIIEDGVIIQLGCRIKSHAKICRGVVMGKENIIEHGAVIGGTPQDLGFNPNTDSGVIIGDGNTFREYVTIHRSTQAGGNTIIGNENYLMAVAHLAHDVMIGDNNILANNTMIAGHVTLGCKTFLGGGAGIHQFTRVGDCAMVQGNAVMTRDVPPYCIVHQVNQLSGLNSIGLKRAGFSSEERKEIKLAYITLFRRKGSRAENLAEADLQTWGEAATLLIDAVRTPSSKGILTR